jgi:hypothetical protein
MYAVVGDGWKSSDYDSSVVDIFPIIEFIKANSLIEKERGLLA